MAVQKLVGLVGLSKQTAKSSPTANATYGVGLKDGAAFTAPITQDYEDQTLPGGPSDRFAPAVNRTEIMPGAGSLKPATWSVRAIRGSNWASHALPLSGSGKDANTSC